MGTFSWEIILGITSHTETAAESFCSECHSLVDYLTSQSPLSTTSRHKSKEGTLPHLLSLQGQPLISTEEMGGFYLKSTVVWGFASPNNFESNVRTSKKKLDGVRVMLFDDLYNKLHWAVIKTLIKLSRYICNCNWGMQCDLNPKKRHQNDGWKAEINGKEATEKEFRYLYLVVGNYETRSPKILEGRALGFQLPYSATKRGTDLVWTFPFYIEGGRPFFSSTFNLPAAIVQVGRSIRSKSL